MKTQDTIVMLVIVGLIAVGGFYLGSQGESASVTDTGSQGGFTASGYSCPDDLETTVTLTVRNKLNDTGRETYDNAYLIHKVTGGEQTLVQTGTDTTAGTVNLECGNTYRLSLESSDSDGGDSSRILGIDAGEGATVGDNGKYVEFVASGASMNLELQSKQHGVLEFKLYDNKQAAWVFDGNDASATDFELTGTTFKSTTDNATATAVGEGEYLDLALDIKATGSDVDFADHGFWVLVDASTSTWNEPSVRFDGKSLVESSNQLDIYESRAYSDFEFAYFVDASIEDRAKTLDFDIDALSGVNPGATDDIAIQLVSVGGARETSGNMVRFSPVTDAASPAQIYTLQKVTVDIS